MSPVCACWGPTPAYSVHLCKCDGYSTARMQGARYHSTAMFCNINVCVRMCVCLPCAELPCRGNPPNSNTASFTCPDTNTLKDKVCPGTCDAPNGYIGATSGTCQGSGIWSYTGSCPELRKLSPTSTQTERHNNAIGPVL